MAGSPLANLDTSSLIERLRGHVHCLCDEIGIRSVYTYDGLCRAEGHVIQALRGAGYEVLRQTYIYHGLELANLIARSTPQPETRRQYILSAHYDTVYSTPGADDNASAVAILIEVARLARERHLSSSQRTDWQFIAFTAEEPPTFHTRKQGSRVFARLAKKQRMRIDGVVNLEMLGYFVDAPRSQKLPFPLHLLGYPRRGNFTAVIGNWRSRRLTHSLVASMRQNPAMPVEHLIAPERGFLLFPLRLSDHSSFWDRGYPAVMVTDTAFFRNPHYHTMADTPEKLNFAAMAEVVRSLLSFLADTIGEP